MTIGNTFNTNTPAYQQKGTLPTGTSPLGGVTSPNVHDPLYKQGYDAAKGYDSGNQSYDTAGAYTAGNPMGGNIRATEPHGPTTGGLTGASYGPSHGYTTGGSAAMPLDTTTSGVRPSGLATGGMTGTGMTHGTHQGVFEERRHDVAEDVQKELEMKMDELHKLVDGIEYCMLVTRRPDGHLVSRAMKTQRHPSGHDMNLYFFTNTDSHKLDELAHDPHVNLAYLRPNRGEWVSVSGTARMINDRQMIHKLYDSNIKEWLGDMEDKVRNGGPDDPRLGLIFVEPVSVVYHINRSSMSRLISKAKAKLKGEYFPGQGQSEEKMLTPSDLHQAQVMHEQHHMTGGHGLAR